MPFGLFWLFHSHISHHLTIILNTIIGKYCFQAEVFWAGFSWYPHLPLKQSDNYTLNKNNHIASIVQIFWPGISLNIAFSHSISSFLSQQLVFHLNCFFFVVCTLCMCTYFSSECFMKNIYIKIANGIYFWSKYSFSILISDWRIQFLYWISVCVWAEKVKETSQSIDYSNRFNFSERKSNQIKCKCSNATDIDKSLKQIHLHDNFLRHKQSTDGFKKTIKSK